MNDEITRRQAREGESSRLSRHIRTIISGSEEKSDLVDKVRRFAGRRIFLPMMQQRTVLFGCFDKLSEVNLHPAGAFLHHKIFILPSQRALHNTRHLECDRRCEKSRITRC